MKRTPKRVASRLKEVDMDKKVSSANYKRDLEKLQRKLARIQQAYLFSGRSGVIVFEGWDAAGKGGAIRRISAALDPRSFKVWPIGAPRQYYLDRHFLLRFMERLPPRGAISAFDRSWYGRVLVERVEGLTPASRWKAAYDEINNFERMLVDDDIRLVKIFFHITPDEQLARFEQRIRDPLKRWKLSYEDFRNRQKWKEYELAIDEMIERTSPKHAPWTLIPANDKKYARLEAMRSIAKCFGRGVDLSPPALDESLIAEVREHLDVKPSLIDSLAGRTD